MFSLSAAANRRLRSVASPFSLRRLPMLRFCGGGFLKSSGGLACCAVLEVSDALLLGAMGAAEYLAVAGFDAMADHRAAAMGATRRHCLDGAFEAVAGH